MATMRAAVLRQGQLVVDEVPAPVPGPGQVLVETIACGICGSDLHIYQQLDQLVASAEAIGAPFMFDTERDVVMGHEFSARVVEAGPGVTGVTPGDVVVAMPVMIGAEGVKTIGYSNEHPGGYAERMLLSGVLCRKVPAGLDPRHAALTEPMAVGLHAVVRSGIAAGEAACVQGCGPIGLAVIAALRIAGIEPIVASDLWPKRREIARRLGAHEAVDPREEPLVDAWTRLDGAKRLVIYEAVGAPGMIAEAMRAAPAEARIMVVGVCMDRDTFWPMIGVHKQLTIQFALGYTPEEFDRTLQLIADGQIDVTSLITAEVGISGVPEAFATLAQPEGHAKILVEPALG